MANHVKKLTGTAARKLIRSAPFAHCRQERPPWDLHFWPFSFIAHPRRRDPPFVAAYRLYFTLASVQTIRVHVTADERYDLYLDGERIGRGSERGDCNNWFFETYDLHIGAGTHCLVARVWSLGHYAAMAQMTLRHGFLLAPQTEDCARLLGTGIAAWEVCYLTGYAFVRHQAQARFGVPANMVIDGRRILWGFERGEGEEWVRAEAVEKACGGHLNPHQEKKVHKLKPATLPPMMERLFAYGDVRFAEYLPKRAGGIRAVQRKKHIPALAEQFSALYKCGKPFILPPHTHVRLVIDLQNYYCAYPQLKVSGGEGATIDVLWAESLCTKRDNYLEKDNRSEIWGKYFLGCGDRFILDGGDHRTFDTLWWMAGRYVEVVMRTTHQAMTISDFSLYETRYPLESESMFVTDDAALQCIIPLLIRTIQMCCHETYLDCPFYEQLMYSGDSRPQILCGYAISRDDRPARKAIRLFSASLLPCGLTQSRYPSNESQVIPTFSLWWIGMIHDYALWRGDRDFVLEAMAGARRVIDTWLSWRNAEGLIAGVHHWMYVDWLEPWVWGVPPASRRGDVDCIVNWLFVYTLEMAARVEEYLDEPELAIRNRRIARQMSAVLQERFFDRRRNLFADDCRCQEWSEHAQIFAVLSGTLSRERETVIVRSMLRNGGDLLKTTIFSTHYLFEMLYRKGYADAFFERLSLWKNLPDQGFTTTFEVQGLSRSDCHGWGAHPLYHCYASILGVRPSKMGFATVAIRPMLGKLKFAKGKIVHPRGTIVVRLERTDRREIYAAIKLPKGVSGTFSYGGRIWKLMPGVQMEIKMVEQENNIIRD